MSALRYIALVVCSALACIAFAGCAPGADGRNQACANADTLLKGGYDIATASMKDAASKGTAKKLLGCFQDFVGTLNATTQVKATACMGTADIVADIASATAAGAQVTAAIATWQKCSVSALGGV